MDIIKQIAEELQIKTSQAETAVRLIDEGNTIPFIARYRKEATGALNDEVLRNLYERLNYLRNLEEKKEQVLASIEEQGKLTEELKQQIERAQTLVVVDDLYRPYRPKRRTRAIIAKEKGLEPLANLILLQQVTHPIEEEAKAYLNEEKEVHTVEGAIAGAKDIIAVDQFGTLYKGCNSAEAHKNWLGEVTNPRQIKGGLKEALEGADVFIGVSRPGILTTELCKTMNKDAIVFAMANPTPEIMPDEAKAGGVRVMATGRSDFPNQVNNVLCFPGLFKGALSVRARDINDQMKLAAAYAIADLITDADRSEENIIPGAFDPRVAEAVAAAVAKAARETGVARL